jgi:serine/threonine protein kinase
MSNGKYPYQISAGANNTVIALTDKEVAKIFEADTRSDIGSEAEKMKFANTINGLVCKFIRLDFDDKRNHEHLVMERLYPLDYRTHEISKREVIFSVFEDELKALHANGFVHRDIKRPSNIGGEKYDNVFLTDKGLRLIDVGISALKHQVGDKIFNKFVEVELEELAKFKDYFLNR